MSNQITGMKNFSLIEIEKRIKELQKHSYFEKESQQTDIKISNVNTIFIRKFRPGRFAGAFIIDEQEIVPDPEGGNTFIYNIPLHFRVLYYRIGGNLFVEECNPDGANPRGESILTFSEFIYKYWNPEGLLAVEGFLLRES